MNIAKYTTSELALWRQELNLTDDELDIFNLLAKGKSIIYIASELGMSTSTVTRKIRNIRDKMRRCK